MNTDDLLKKWLNEELSQEEARTFSKRDDLPFLKGIVDNAKAFKASEFSVPPSYNELKQQLHAVNKGKSKIRRLVPYLRIASIFIIGFSLFYFLRFENLTSVETQIGEKTTIVLPDASEVTLNAQSEIKFNRKNWDNKREIQLDGEAYFKVAKGRKFDVLTDSGIISVLGTSFNVRDRQGYFEVSCFSGKVMVTSGFRKAILQEGESFRIYKGVVSEEKFTSAEASWLTNMSDFKRVEVSEVFKEFQRQYRVTLVLEGVDADQLFSGGFVHDNLEDALRSITTPLNLEYKFITADRLRIKPLEK